MLRQLEIKYENFLSLSILTSTLTAYAIIPTNPATVPVYLLTIIFIFFFVLFPKDDLKYKNTFFQFFIFVLLFGIYALVTQLCNWLLPVEVPQTITLVESSSGSSLFFRTTLFTQSAYLIINIFIYIFIKNYADDKLLKYIHWAFRILILYGVYEFVFYLIFNKSGDFVSNRVFIDDPAAFVGGSFQIQYIGSTTLQRIKGFVGEPSMFSFIVVPYFVLLVGLKKNWEAALCFVCLLFTFSTTAFLGLFIFAFYSVFTSPNKKLRYGVLLTMVALIVLFVILWTTNEIFQDLIDVIFLSKFSGDSVSGDQRSSLFMATFNFWRNSDFLHLLFGYGFGYARSTDFLSTLLFNVGLLGFLSFTIFIFSHYLIQINDKVLKRNYRLILIIIYVSMMISVPEFAYTCIWVILASGYIFKNFKKNDAEIISSVVKQ